MVKNKTFVTLVKDTTSVTLVENALVKQHVWGKHTLVKNKHDVGDVGGKSNNAFVTLVTLVTIQISNDCLG